MDGEISVNWGLGKWEFGNLLNLTKKNTPYTFSLLGGFLLNSKEGGEGGGRKGVIFIVI